MKITKITPYLVAASPVRTAGRVGRSSFSSSSRRTRASFGWGEAYALNHRQRAIREIILALGEALKQMGDATPRGFLHHLAKPMDSKHPGIDYASAVSAIEIALWDLLGKSAGMPLHALLGGALIDKVPVYANAWDEQVQSPQAVADRCAMMRSQGYRAVKIYPLRRATLEEAEACVRLTREAVGPDVDIMLDFAVQEDRRHALRAARLFEPYHPYWIEEPVAGDDLASMAEFRAGTIGRITTGERQAGIAPFSRRADVHVRPTC